MPQARFDTTDVADYYDQTLIHYKQWWNLSDSHSLHYGMWLDGTTSFKESLLNTNKVMAEKAQIKPDAKVLDAGCGVGGAAMYLAETRNCNVRGITLSTKQVEFAKQSIERKNLQDKVQVEVMDYTNTDFADSEFDNCWACESSSSALQATSFCHEMYRLLKPGGSLVLTDFFWPKLNMNDVGQYMKKWGDTWGISSFDDIEAFNKHLEVAGFVNIRIEDYTDEVTPSAKRMYKAYRLGAPFSRLYNLLHRRKVSRFARTHFLCGKYQYKALINGLWRYYLITADKP